MKWKCAWFKWVTACALFPLCLRRSCSGCLSVSLIHFLVFPVHTVLTKSINVSQIKMMIGLRYIHLTSHILKDKCHLFCSLVASSMCFSADYRSICVRNAWLQSCTVAGWWIVSFLWMWVLQDKVQLMCWSVAAWKSCQHSQHHGKLWTERCIA